MLQAGVIDRGADERLPGKALQSLKLSQPRAADSGPIENQHLKVGQFLQMDQSGVSNRVVVKAELTKARQSFQVDQPGIADLREGQIQPLHARQPLQVSRPVVGNGRKLEVQVPKLAEVPDGDQVLISSPCEQADPGNVPEVVNADAIHEPPRCPWLGLGSRLPLLPICQSFSYLVVAMRGSGSMIISPQGKVIATAEGPDGLAIARIDPLAGRERGDAYNTQRDMRGRLFRERVPKAYGILTDPAPPVLAKVPSNVTTDEAIRIHSTVLTSGEERFNKAENLARAGKTEEAIKLLERLCEECRTSWIDRVGRERLRKLRAPETSRSPTDR
jgi:hypothetical protein